MVKLADSNHTTLSIIDNRRFEADMRPYLGGSQIGKCPRFVWYSFRWCFTEMLANRIYRLFNRGHREEEIFIENLQYAGIHVYGEQKEITFAYGHGRGHIDGLGTNVREAHKSVHLLEFKTMNSKYFRQTKAEGVKKAKPEYFDQCQIYMSKLNNVERTLFCAVNKDDDEYYIERLKLDKHHADLLERKAEAIVLSEYPPNRIKEDPTWYECKFCPAANVCHHGQPPNPTCRICVNMGIENDGWWSCGYHGIYLATEQQKLMCDQFQLQEM